MRRAMFPSHSVALRLLVQTRDCSRLLCKRIPSVMEVTQVIKHVAVLAEQLTHLKVLLSSSCGYLGKTTCGPNMLIYSYKNAVMLVHPFKTFLRTCITCVRKQICGSIKE